MPPSISNSEALRVVGEVLLPVGLVRLTVSDRPGVVQPVPRRDIPQRPWAPIILGAALLSLLLIAGWEIYWLSFGVTPDYAVRSGYPGSRVYSMTKAAVAVMLKGFAIDLASRGVTVNNIQPAPTVTDMTVDHIETIRPLNPLKHAGEPDEIAGLVARLARKESGYITGSSLTIDGGMAL